LGRRRRRKQRRRQQVQQRLLVERAAALVVWQYKQKTTYDFDDDTVEGDLGSSRR
jgi:hypothetical protein